MTLGDWLRRTTRTTRVLFVLGGAALAQLTFLLHERSAAPRSIQVGDVLPELVVEQKGIPLRLASSQLAACTYVVFFSPSCPASARAVPQWNLESGSGDRIRLIGVSYAGWKETDDFVAGHDLGFPVFASGDADVARAAARTGILSVPQVVVLDAIGRVAAVGDSRAQLADLARAANCPGGGFE